MEIPQKNPKRTMQFDPAIPLPGICAKKRKSPSQRNKCLPLLTAALFTIAKKNKKIKKWRQPKLSPVDEWIKKMFHIYICTHTHTHRNITWLRERKAFAKTRMKIEGNTLSKRG